MHQSIVPSCAGHTSLPGQQSVASNQSRARRPHLTSATDKGFKVLGHSRAGDVERLTVAIGQVESRQEGQMRLALGEVEGHPHIPHLLRTVLLSEPQLCRRHLHQGGNMTLRQWHIPRPHADAQQPLLLHLRSYRHAPVPLASYTPPALAAPAQSAPRRSPAAWKGAGGKAGRCSSLATAGHPAASLG